MQGFFLAPIEALPEISITDVVRIEMLSVRRTLLT